MSLICNAPFCENPRNRNHAWCPVHRWERFKFKIKPFKQIQLFNPKIKKTLKLTKEQNKRYNQKYSNYRRNQQYLKRYGVTREYYLKLLDLYNHQCAICKSKATKKHPLHLDHCHITGKIRGIICYKCNVALGYFQDSIPNLVAAINYLRHHF